MAYNDPQDNSNQPGQDPTQPQSGTNSASSGSSGQQNSNPYQAQKQGSGFTNIQQIIGANSQNKLGQTVGSGVTNTANQANQNINNAQNQFQQDSTASNQDTQSNRDYINNTYSNIKNQAVPNQPSSGATALDQSNAAANMYTAAGAAATPPPSTSSSGAASGAYSYPTGAYNPNQDQSKFNQFTSGQYTGPQNLSNLNNLQTQSADVNNLQNSLNSQEGRQGLLQRFVGGNQQYGQGEQNLDALLLGRTGAPQLSQARLATQALPDLNNLSAADTAAAQTMQNRAQDLAAFTKAGAQSTAGDINNYLTQQSTQQQAAADAQYQPLIQHIKSGALTDSDQANIKNLLGLDPNAPIYGSKNDILTALTNGIQEGKYNNSNVANQQQYASQQALQQLSGLQATDLGQNGNVLNLDASQVGTAGPALGADQAIKNSLNNEQLQGAQNFTNEYNKSGILSREELDFLNTQAIQDQLKGIGGALNSYDQQDAEGQARANSQVSSGENALQQQFKDFDTSQGQGGLARYSHNPGMTAGYTYNSNPLDLADFGGNRSYARGEGVSAFIKNIQDQQAKRQSIEKNNNRFNNLSELLASNPTPLAPGAS